MKRKQCYVKRKQSYRNENPISEKRTILQQNDTQSNNTEETLTIEHKTKLENLKRILDGKNTTLPSMRNRQWRTVKTETEKINQILRYISEIV